MKSKCKQTKQTKQQLQQQKENKHNDSDKISVGISETVL